MSLASLTVGELVAGCGDGRFDVPEFQRAFVWRPDQVRALIDSLYRGYPIGQVLTWAAPRYGAGNPGPEEGDGKHWLVDGQQRATALCLVFGRRPRWWTDEATWNQGQSATNVLANVAAAGTTVEFGLSNPVRAPDPRWVPVRGILVRDPGDVESSAERQAAAILSRLPSSVRERRSEAEITERLRSIAAIRDREIPLTEVRHGIEDVAEIFTRLNQQGTEVRESDVSLAVAAAYHPGWVREEFLPFLRNLADSGFELEGGVVLRVLASLGCGSPRLDDMPREFWKGPAFPKAWAETKGALSGTVTDLVGAGVPSTALLPSRNALVPLALLRARFAASGFQFARAFHWFLLAGRDGRYSGASTTALAEDARSIRDAGSFAEALSALRESLAVEPRVAAEEFVVRAQGNRSLVLLQYLALVAQGALDWTTGEPIGRHGSAPELGFVPYWHPFFPTGASGLRAGRYDFTDDEIGALGNLVVLNARPTTRAWRLSAPARYLQGTPVSDERLESQLVPTDPELWTIERYRDFLQDRSRRLARAANAYLAEQLGAPA